MKIAEKLDAILREEVLPSCKQCEAIGDAVISLEVPQGMCLEHSDYSFDHLCEVIEKPHFRHPSEKALIRNTI